MLIEAFIIGGTGLLALAGIRALPRPRWSGAEVPGWVLRLALGIFVSFEALVALRVGFHL